MKIEVKSEVKPIDYSISMRVLEKRAKDVFLGKKNELLWIIEHNPVYTAGSSAKSKDLIDKDIKVIKTNRGGKYTFHGPGQKVVYFVLNLNKRGKDIRKLINKIEKCLIDILSEYNVEAYPDKKNIGIWVGQKNNSKKISNDLSKYKGIIPCGIKDKGITSLKEIGVKNFKNVESVIKKKFLNVFP